MIAPLESSNCPEHFRQDFVKSALVSFSLLAFLTGCDTTLPNDQNQNDISLDEPFSEVDSTCVQDFSTNEVILAAAEVQLGDERGYDEEQPIRVEFVEMFAIDTTEVTNKEFAEFVKATGYVTTSERPPDPSVVPEGAPATHSLPGAVVFTPPQNANQNWWRYVPGANWKHPLGPESGIDGQDQHPVVQVSFEDATAYAAWKERRLPTEAEWEYAARSGFDNAIYEWGDKPNGQDGWQANTWQGIFPLHNTGDDGFLGTSPVGCFAPNVFGLYDMTGNVWEWTSSSFVAPSHGMAEPVNVIKGGSYLCAMNFCARFRPSARQGQEAGLPTNHIGFRTVRNVDAKEQFETPHFDN